jgi:hypothetical protein
MQLITFQGNMLKGFAINNQTALIKPHRQKVAEVFERNAGGIQFSH